MAQGIRRIVQLILDKATAAQVRRETAEALDKGTDPRKAKRNVKQVEGAFDQLKAKAKKLGAALIAVFAIRNIIAFGKEVFQLGLAAEETASKFSTVFGPVSEDMDAFIGDFRILAGLTRTEGREMAATMGAIAQGLGFSVENSANFSARVLELAADLQSFNNVPIEETFAALRSGLTGETEPLKRFGIVISQADVQLRAMTETGKGTVASLTAQELAAARLNLIYEKAGVAVGDLGRTQLSTANIVRRTATAWRDLKEAIGVALVSGGQGVSLFEKLTRVLQNLTQAVERNHGAFEGFGLILGWVATAAGMAWDGLSRIAHGITGVLMGAVAGGAHTLGVLSEGLALASEAAAKLLNLLGMRGTSDSVERFAERIRRASADLRNFAAIAKETEIGLYDDMFLGNRSAPPPSGGLRAPPRMPGAAPGGGGGGGGAGGGGGGGGAGPPSFGDITGGLVGGTVALPTPTLDPVPVQTSLEKIAATFYETEYEITAGVQRVSSAFVGAFQAIADGSASTGEAFAGIGLQMVAGLTEGMAEYHFAQAAGKLAEGLWPPNPLAWASAAKHALAGAAFAAITGFARAGARGGGRNGGGASRGGSAAALARTPTAEKPGNEIHIHFVGPGFDAVNPRVQKVVAGAMRNLGERHGSNYTVQTHQRGG